MLADHDSVRIDGLYMVAVFLEISHTLGVVRFDPVWILCESFRKVETESVDLVFLDEILEILLHIFAEHRVAVVPLMVHIVWMRRGREEPWIAFGDIVHAVIPVEGCIWMHTGSMIVDNIEEDGHSSLMAGIDECLVVVPRSIYLVHSEICVSSVSPAVVTIEFLHRHELDDIHSEFVEIVEVFHRCLEVAFPISVIGKVTKEKLVDNKIILVFYLIISDFPIIFRTIYLECRDKSRGRIATAEARIDVALDPFVVACVIEDFRVRIECAPVLK